MRVDSHENVTEDILSFTLEKRTSVLNRESITYSRLNNIASQPTSHQLSSRGLTWLLLLALTCRSFFYPNLFDALFFDALFFYGILGLEDSLTGIGIQALRDWLL